MILEILVTVTMVGVGLVFLYLSIDATRDRK